MLQADPKPHTTKVLTKANTQVSTWESKTIKQDETQISFWFQAKCRVATDTKLSKEQSTSVSASDYRQWKKQHNMGIKKGLTCFAE